MSTASSLFVPVDGEAWLPTDVARGPWSPDSLHGGPVAALLAGAAEQAADADPGTADIPMHSVRLTVELVRPVPVAPLTVGALVARPGKKVQLIDADVRSADGVVVATARLLRIRAKDVEAPVTTRGLRTPKGPERLQAADSEMDVPHAYVAFHTHGVEHRFAKGMFGVPGPATDWIRLRVPVVPDREPTPLQRVAAAADFGNGVSSVATFGTLLFINPDLTIYLHRAPSGSGCAWRR